VEKTVNLQGFQSVYKPGNVDVHVDHNGMAAHLNRSDCEGFLRCACCTSNAVDGTDDDML